MALDFPDRPNCNTEELRQDVVDLVSQLQTRTITATVGASETVIAHGLGQTPASVSVLPHADRRVWRVRASDRQYLYLQASASAECTITVSL